MVCIFQILVLLTLFNFLEPNSFVSYFQKIMTDFVNIEMIYHAKALEMYTECFQNIKTFDIEEDIEVHVFIFYCLRVMHVNVIQRENIIKN